MKDSVARVLRAIAKRIPWTLCVSLLLTGCAPFLAGREPALCSLTPVPYADLQPTTPLSARVALAAWGRSVALTAVGEATAEGFVLVGLGLDGGRLFALRQEGERVVFDPASASPALGPRPAEALARGILDALVRGMWLRPPPGAQTDGFSWRGEWVVETRLESGWRREFFEGPKPGGHSRAVIDYRGDGVDGGYDIEHGDCRYRATVISIVEPAP